MKSRIIHIFNAVNGYKKKVRDRLTYKFLAAIIICCIVLIGVVYYSIQGKNKEEQLRNPYTAAQDEKNILLDKIKRHTKLPVDELPIIATVEDPSQLRDNSFFKRAKRGFKVITYKKSDRIILYDPVTDHIVEDAAASTVH